MLRYKVRLRETNACIDSMRVQRRSLMILPPEDSKSLVCPYVQEIEKKQSLGIDCFYAMLYKVSLCMCVCVCVSYSYFLLL